MAPLPAVSRTRSSRARPVRCYACGRRHEVGADCPADPIRDTTSLLAPVHSDHRGDGTKPCGFRHPPGSTCPPVRLVAPGVSGSDRPEWSGRRLALLRMFRTSARRRRARASELRGGGAPLARRTPSRRRRG